MQQYQEVFTSSSTPMTCLTLGFILYVLFSKVNFFIKVPSIFCSLYVYLVIFYPKVLEEYLGGGMQVVSLVCFTFAVLAFLFSVFRFLKASVNIICWLVIAVVAGSVAFPDFTKVQIQRTAALTDYVKQEKLTSAMNNIKTGFFSKSLE